MTKKICRASKLSLLLLSVVFTSFSAWGQQNVGIRFFGLSIHPHGEKANAAIMPLKLDKDAYFVQNLGGILSYETSIYKGVFLAKGAIGLYSDCAARFAGFFHIGLRGRIFQTSKHSLYGGIGPTLIFRRNWLQIEEYKDQKLFKGNKENIFQYLFLWYGGEFEYRYKIAPQLDGVVSFIPGYPDLMSLSIGLNYNF